MGNIWKIVLATIVIFGAGVVTGGVLVSHGDRMKIQRALRQSAARGNNWQPAPRDAVEHDSRELRPMLEQQRMNFMLRTSRDLELTPVQREHIEKIVREGQERTKEFWEKAAPELRKNLQEVREQIQTELTPPQRIKFEEILKQQRQARTQDQPTGPGRPQNPNQPFPQRDGTRPQRPFNPPPATNTPPPPFQPQPEPPSPPEASR
jgi:hypothetical protein